MNTIRAAATASTLVLALALAGCSDATKKEFGIEANPPDAFQVGTQPPLSLPPELGQLPAPNPGEPRPQAADAAADGADILAPGGSTAPAAATPGEQALLQQSGPTPPAGIRATVNQSALIASKPPGFVSSLMGSGPAPAPIVNAPAEQQRLQENEALGQPVTAGATPQQTDEKPGLLHRFLNIF
ncbi:DUF3035 domain-containing protein [Acidocella sp.]|uniref:DUF3035 domain-containing protein n=1 Tax=Acidocella sp. TaxID=50710 RepID=UPI00262FD8B0|nr:DUF3035 domain-containing protein [Acidocella sp.]